MNENNELKDLSDLLFEVVKVFREDRARAKDNYNALRNQLEEILKKDLEGSEEYKLEAEVNKALKLVFDSANRLEKVVESITKITISQMTNESRERVASTFINGAQGGNFDQPVIGKVNIAALLEEKSDDAM